MSITPTTLLRGTAVAAVLSGMIFIGVQINHPHSDVAATLTTEWAVRNAFKVVMAALALAGITGMYARQIRQVGLLGLLGYVVFAVGYLTILSVAFISAFVLPTVAVSDPDYVSSVLAVATGRGTATVDIGLMQTALSVSGVTYLAGGLIFGIALFRTGVLYRWAAVLLALASVFTAALAVLPDAFYRFLAFPNAIAMIGLGWSLWLSTRTPAPASIDVLDAAAGVR